MRRRFLAAVLTFSLCAAVPAQQQAAGHQREGDDANPPERVRQFAALPNWTGVWETELSAQLNSGELDKAMAEAVRHPERNTTVLAPKGVLHPAETLFFSRMQLIREPPYNPEWQRRYERLSQKIRQDELTIEDPARLTRPWNVTLRFRRVKDMDRLIPTDCTEKDHYRVVQGKMTITAP